VRLRHDDVDARNALAKTLLAIGAAARGRSRNTSKPRIAAAECEVSWVGVRSRTSRPRGREIERTSARCADMPERGGGAQQSRLYAGSNGPHRRAFRTSSARWRSIRATGMREESRAGARKSLEVM